MSSAEADSGGGGSPAVPRESVSLAVPEEEEEEAVLANSKVVGSGLGSDGLADVVGSDSEQLRTPSWRRYLPLVLMLTAVGIGLGVGIGVTASQTSSSSSSSSSPSPPSSFASSAKTAVTASTLKGTQITPAKFTKSPAVDVQYVEFRAVVSFPKSPPENLANTKLPGTSNERSSDTFTENFFGAIVVGIGGSAGGFAGGSPEANDALQVIKFTYVPDDPPPGFVADLHFRVNNPGGLGATYALRDTTQALYERLSLNPANIFTSSFFQSLGTPTLWKFEGFEVREKNSPDQSPPPSPPPPSSPPPSSSTTTSTSNAPPNPSPPPSPSPPTSTTTTTQAREPGSPNQPGATSTDNTTSSSSSPPGSVVEVTTYKCTQSNCDELYPARVNDKYITALGNSASRITDKALATQYNNYYEFGLGKSVSSSAMLAQDFLRASRWEITIEGRFRRNNGNSITITAQDLIALLKDSLEERTYRLRCVEAWSMVVPWTGIPVRALLDWLDPTEEAKYVSFVGWKNTTVSTVQRSGLGSFPWPYQEALLMEEAQNDLAMLVTGAYGEPLKPQSGAPIRLIVPWKYGFKSGKSIQKIVLSKEPPSTFWKEAGPSEYGFFANVNPEVNHKRWSQASERQMWTVGGTEPQVPTAKWNGYGEWVETLYDPWVKQGAAHNQRCGSIFC